MCCTVFTLPAMYPLVSYLYPTLCTDSSVYLPTYPLFPHPHTPASVLPLPPTLQPTHVHTPQRTGTSSRGVVVRSVWCQSHVRPADSILFKLQPMAPLASVNVCIVLLKLVKPDHQASVYVFMCARMCVYEKERKKEKETSGEKKDKGRTEEKTVFEGKKLERKRVKGT